MQRVKIALVCLSWLWLAGAVSAQTEIDPASNSGIATVTNYSGGGVLDGTYFDVRHVIGDGVGYINSYSQIGAFTPIWLNDDAFIAPNERIIITNSTQTGINVGLVGRQYVNSWDRIVGAYAYYDNDQDSRNFRYSQATVGAETLGNWWDLRANGYLLTGNDNNFISNLGLIGNPFYFGNSIGFKGQTLRDQSLGGGDIEYGMPVSPWTKWLRGYGGAYFYHKNSDSNAVGFRGRLEATVSNDLTLNVQISQDPLYGTNINGMIDFKFSGFQPTRYFPSLTTRQRMLNPVQRNWRIATRTFIEDVNVAGINPATGNPYFIVHVDNSAAPGGNGTIEHPFTTLQAGPNPLGTDIILVHRGFATSEATAVTGSVTLSNNERLLGDGLLAQVPLIAKFGSSSINGTFNLPGTSNTGIFPYVKNPAGNVVTLMNNNEVAALNFVGSAGTAITNTAAGSHNFFLHDLEITGNGGKGIALSGASGAGIITRINTGTTDHLNPGGLGNNAGGGIQISTANPALFLQLTNVNMNSTPAAAQLFGISLSANAGGLNTIFNNVTTNGNTVGIQLTETSQQMIVNMDTVRSVGNTGPGIQIKGTGGLISVTGDNVGSLNNGGDNLQIGTQAAPIVTSTVGVEFTNSNFSGSTGGSGIVFSQSGGVGTLNLPISVANGPGANVSGNAIDGLSIYATNSTLMNANVQNGQFGLNGRDGFHVEADTGSTVNLHVDPTNVSRNGRDGLFFALGQDSVLNATFLNDNMNNNGRSAVFGTLTDFAVVNMFLNNTTGANSGANGFIVNASNNSLANLEIDNGTFANSGQTVAGSSAINIQSDNSTVNLLTNFTPGNNIKPNTLPGNEAYGLTLNLLNNSVFTGNVYNTTFSDALVDAINVNATNGTVANLTLLNVEAARSGLDGFGVTVDNAQFNVSASNVDGTARGFNNSGRDGMNFNVSNGGQFTAAFSNSSFNNNGASGMLGIVTGATSVANIGLTNGSVVNSNGDSGLTFNLNAGQLNLTALSSSFSNNGLAGVTGSGVLGTMDNGGVGRLTFINTGVNNNLDNGIFVTTQNGSAIQTSFSLGSIANNGTGTLSPHHNDGIRLEMDDSGASNLHVFNGTLIQGNGDNGIALVASNQTHFTGVFDSISLINNGTATPAFAGTRAGLSMTTTTNSQVNLSLHAMTSGNTTLFGPQFEGFLSNTTSGGIMTASLTSVNLSNNQIDAINANVTGNSRVNMSLANVIGDNSGNTGALFSVTSGSQLNVNSTVNSSFSNSGGSGMLVTVDGAGSIANLDLDSITLAVNGGTFGGQGFTGVATGGATLNTVITNSNLSNNLNEGMQITVVNQNSLANFQVTGTSVDFNSNEGLLIRVADQGVLNYRSIGTTYDSNGNNGVLDGINVSVVGNGPADSATARLLFAGGSADSNTGNGISLDAENGATLTTSMISMSASNNGGFGVMTTATGANTEFNLLMSGANVFDSNALGSVGPLTFTGINQAVIVLTGSFNTSTGDGINASFTNVNNAAFALVGPNTVDGNAGDGVDVTMTNVLNGSILFQGVSSINDNAQDGIRLTMDNVTNGSLDLIGPTDIQRSGARGVDVNVINGTNLINGNPLDAVQIQVLTLTNSLPFPLNGQLPVPVTTTLDSLGIIANTALVISGQHVDNAGADGISLNIQDSHVQDNSSFILNNSGSNAKGDGILITVDNSSAIGMTLIANSAIGNTQNGIDIVANNAFLQNMTMAGGGGSIANVGLDLTIIGFTNNGGLGAYNIINTSTTAGENLTSFTLDLSTSATNAIFNTVAGASVPFTPFGGTDATTGLTTVNGTAVPPYPANLVPDFSQFLGLTFNNFVPGGNFQWDIDTDLTPGGDEATTGADLIGSTITVGFTGGATLTGALVPLAGFPDGSHFVATSGSNTTAAISGNTLDGIRFSLNNTDMSNLTMSNNKVSGNGVAPAVGHGIEFTGSGGAVANSTLTGLTLSGNQVDSNTGDGLRIVDPNTTNSTIQMTLTNNEFSQNNGTGVNLSLVAGQQNLQASFTGNTITQNANGPGINIHLADNRNMTGGFDGNTVSTNGAQGINFNMGTNGVVTSNFTNNVINGNVSDGINIALKTGGHFEGAVFTGNTIGIATAHNGGLGVRLTVPDQATFNWNLGDSTQTANQINGNTGAGVGIDMSGSGSGNLRVENSSFNNTLVGTDPNFTGDGLAIRLAGNAFLDNAVIGHLDPVNSQATNDVTFASNANSGLSFFATNASKIDNLLVTNVNALNNAADGISFLRQGTPTFTNITVQNSLLQGNRNGLHIIATNALLVDDYKIDNLQVLSNTNDGILIDARFDAQIVANITNSTINNNTNDGIHLIEQQNASSDNRLITGTWTGNTITNNLNGIEISARSNINIGANTTQVQNTISNNRGIGININGVNAFTTTVIQGNLIDNNGAEGINLNGTANNLTIDTNQINGNFEGVELLAQNGATINVSVDNNVIRFNTDDGVQIQSSGQRNTGGLATINIGTNNPNGNDISDNGGFGINMLNNANGNARLSVDNNNVSRNGLAGVYVVNTASATQSQEMTFTLAADGDVHDRSQMQFEMTNNAVLDNGHAAIGGLFSDTTGLYVRVGTNGALDNVTTDPGGFASNASNVNSVTTASLTGRGGVLAMVTNNVFGGNAGHDVSFESFKSTVDPATTAGTWTDQNDSPPNPANDVFQVNSYTEDPLARLDLRFTGNVGQDADVTRSGSGTSQIAAYNNAEDTFKSRINNNPGSVSPPGPFDSSTRERNATRQASRAFPFNAPTTSPASPFFYPGVGASTFRVSTDSDFNNIGNANTNNFGSVNTSFNSAVGLGVGIGELPFIWQTNLAP